MNLPRGSLRTFLESAKSNLHNAITSQQRVTIVIGNESADLDSITSAIVLAYLKSSSISTPLTNKSVNKHTSPSQYPPLYIPLINVPRTDINIRPELLQLLPYANLEPKHLITLDDLSTTAPAGLDPAERESLQPRFTRLVLTDHNKLAGPLAKSFSDRVIGCIDHHVDEHVIAPTTDSEIPRIITTAGSCTSLVIQHCREAWDNLSSNNNNTSSSSIHDSDAPEGQDDIGVGIDDTAVRHKWDAQIAKLAMASILIDTSNLKSKDKTEDVDRQVVDYLGAKIALAPDKGLGGTKWDRDSFFQEISTAKKDLSRLNLQDVLRKDYKQWEVNKVQLGISSVVKQLCWQIQKAEGSAEKFVIGIRQFADERELDVFAIMTMGTSIDNQFQRELLLQSCSDKGDVVVETFGQQFGSQLDLETWNENADVTKVNGNARPIRVWWQRDVSKSRKQVAPLIRQAIEEL